MGLPPGASDPGAAAAPAPAPAPVPFTDPTLGRDFTEAPLLPLSLS